ncbi:MAG TPA: DUF6636 domain-containing protein [Gaiellaceae bacterium]|nr:DUF6636 domain-containing protein [Gaiellaceae bacterium]
MRALLVGLLALALTLAAPAAASIRSFRTPSGNIGCVYASSLGKGGPYLRCDIGSRLKPKPPKPKGCNFDWGDSFEMHSTGRVDVTCHGDTAIIPTSKVLRYGQRWSRGGFTCLSRKVGLRCRNKSGHGFFLSRQHSYSF